MNKLLKGVIMLGHSGLDRILGYGLKYLDSFQHTHVGWVGRQRPPAGAEAKPGNSVNQGDVLVTLH